ncbi:MAG TPA: ExeM/NucH family extracellular endonuclease [Acidimicrobiia bacterium]|nr:ExeM/NucH family extracellular endonuclease [Acidimicrobiia bacterium]
MTRTRSRLSPLILIGLLISLLPLGVLPAAATTGDLVITGVIDGPLTGGLPKAVELYVANDIPDLSIYGVGSANNGGGTDGEEFTFPADSAVAGDFIYLATEVTGFTEFFGLAPDYTHGGAVSVNGDDAIELFMNGVVVDVFGEIDLSGTGQPWDYLDGWAYRVSGTGQDGTTFTLGNWTFSGPNALDGESSNATAASPFPLQSYTEDPPPPPPPPASILINEVDSDTPGVDAAEFVELYGAPNTSLDGLVLVFYNGSGDLTYGSVDLDGVSTDPDGYAVICGEVDATFLPNCDLDSSVVIQNGPDAVALYEGDATDFPGNRAIITDGLVDALVYDTDDADDTVLLTLLNPGQPQVNEGGAGDAAAHSNQRCPNGSGGARNTETYAQFAPTVGTENVCSVAPPEPVTRKIHEIQGGGEVSPLEGSAAIVEAVVVGDFQGDAALRGFYLQEEDSDVDADPLTSEGIFVFDGSFGVDVSEGDLVQVTGTVDEFNGLTEITTVTSVEVISSGHSVTPATISLPLTSVTDLEAFEGMSVHIPQQLFISEFFNFDRFGEIVLTSQRQFQPTALFEPGSPEAEQLAIDNALGRITLDDGRTSQNPDPAIHPNGDVFDMDNLFRGGDTVANVVGVLDFAFGLYRIHPTQGADFEVQNPRPKKPDKVGGSIEVAAFNVLNYFSTIDTGVFICGPLENQECRGADTAEEFTRQRDKIISALARIDADIVGLMEIENHVTDAALADLVAGLNDRMGHGTYDYIGEGPIGPDAIRIAIIYKPKKVIPVGEDAVLDSDAFLDPNGSGDAKNRPAQAQTFREKKSGELLTVVVNHLKSKGSGCGAGDDDPVQGNCNLTRTLSAQVLADWLATDPTGSGDPDQLIIGDLNSYDKEDPIDALIAGSDDAAGTSDDFTDLLDEFEGENAYTYLFDGQLGYLDYALASQSLVAQVTGATAWHINADEPDIIDYDTTFKMDAQDALYAPDQYRSSDHDAVIVGLRLDQKPPKVKANLDRIFAHHDRGWFRVDFSCKDEVDRSPECVADLNGIPVQDGQKVYLIRSPGVPWTFGSGRVLFIKDESFLLTVTGTDDSGNSATDSDEPRFRRRGHH